MKSLFCESKRRNLYNKQLQCKTFLQFHSYTYNTIVHIKRKIERVKIEIYLHAIIKEKTISNCIWRKKNQYCIYVNIKEVFNPSVLNFVKGYKIKFHILLTQTWNNIYLDRHVSCTLLHHSIHRSNVM